MSVVARCGVKKEGQRPHPMLTGWICSGRVCWVLRVWFWAFYSLPVTQVETLTIPILQMGKVRLRDFK